MADITNVNLLFQRKIRGLAPLSRYAVQNDGSLVASVPEEMEVRTFHIVRFDTKGKWQVLETYNVETLRKTEIAASGTNFVGASDDHCYLFRDGNKSRFMTDRSHTTFVRASYTDIALSPEGQRFAVSYSDMLASGYSVAFGDIGGRVLWTKDMAFPVRRVAVDREMNFIAAAGDTGDIQVMDTGRGVLIQHRQTKPISALATNGPTRTVFAGGGGVGAIEADGQLAWFTEIVGEPLEVALDTQNQTAAVIVRLDESSGRLILFSESGLPTWDVDYDEARPTGLSLSADGRFVAVSLRDGTVTVYELFYGERLAGLDTEQVLAEANAARDSGNLQGAVLVLKNRLDAVPSDTAACDLLQTTLNEFRERAFAASATAEAIRDFAEADARLSDYLQANPHDAEAMVRRQELRCRWCAEALATGHIAQAEGDTMTAEVRFLEAIAANPLDVAARAALAAARIAAADVALTRGQQLLKMGQFTEAISALTEAQRRGAHGPDVTGLLRQSRVGEALTLGNALYQDRQYAAALFQFKKVLRLDPDNTEARQKVNYAQNFLQDTQLNERFTRLE